MELISSGSYWEQEKSGAPTPPHVRCCDLDIGFACRNCVDRASTGELLVAKESLKENNVNCDVFHIRHTDHCAPLHPIAINCRVDGATNNSASGIAWRLRSVMHLESKRMSTSLGVGVTLMVPLNPTCVQRRAGETRDPIRAGSLLSKFPIGNPSPLPCSQAGRREPRCRRT
jgi:hypothetical protein